MKTRSNTHAIHPYGVNIEVVVCDSVNLALKHPSRVRKFGKYKDADDNAGISVGDGPEYGILMQRPIDHWLIAHEVFHVAIRIIRRAGVSMAGNAEACAYLIGYITGLIYKDLKNWKETI